MQYTTGKNYGSEKMGMRMGGKRTSRPWYLLLQNRRRCDGEHAFRDEPSRLRGSAVLTDPRARALIACVGRSHSVKILSSVMDSPVA